MNLQDFQKTRLVEVNANEFWDNDDVSPNLDFLIGHNRASKPDYSMFLMDGSNYPEQINAAKEAGCTADFIAAYSFAVNELGAELVLFHHDV